MSVNLSSSMLLPIPQVGNEAGPQYATDINSCLTIVDGHNHSAGYGVQVMPSGININSDLTFQNNNGIALRSLRLQPQVALLAGVADLGCIYESGVDLYYNDGSGNQVRITSGGAVAGTPGSIANLVSPASASYVAGTQTFIFQSAANTPGNIDGGSFIIRDVTANSKGITLSAPVALAADYVITLPAALPGTRNIVTLDASGNLAAALNVDNVTLDISTNTLEVKNGGVSQAKLYTRTTGTSAAAGNVAISSSSGSYFAQPDYTVSIVSCTLICTGRPVFISMIPDVGGTDANAAEFSVSQNSVFLVAIFRDAIQISSTEYSPLTTLTPPGAFNAMDIPAAGSHVYSLRARVISGTGGIGVQASSLMAYEL